VLTGLQPSRRYYYTYGSNRTGFSAEASFRAAPPAGPDEEVHILALADMGQAQVDESNEETEMPPSLNTTALMLRDAAGGQYGLVAHLGDISYAEGHVSQWDRCAATWWLWALVA
jgi:acid phosphatase type 7